VAAAARARVGFRDITEAVYQGARSERLWAASRLARTLAETKEPPPGALPLPFDEDDPLETKPAAQARPEAVSGDPRALARAAAGAAIQAVEGQRELLHGGRLILLTSMEAAARLRVEAEREGGAA